MNVFFRCLYYTVGKLLKWVFRVEAVGADRLPRSGALLCPNHASDIDPVLILMCLPADYRLHIMAKKELFQNPVKAWFFRKVGAFPVNREGVDIKAVKTAMQSIERGDNLLVFLEGTTIHNGIGTVDGLPAHAHAGVAMIAVRTGAKLIPVFAGGEKKLFHKTRIVFGEPYEPVYTGRRGTSEELQKIADDVLERAYALGGRAVGGKPL